LKKLIYIRFILRRFVIAKLAFRGCGLFRFIGVGPLTESGRGKSHSLSRPTARIPHINRVL